MYKSEYAHTDETAGSTQDMRIKQFTRRQRRRRVFLLVVAAVAVSTPFRFDSRFTMKRTKCEKNHHRRLSSCLFCSWLNPSRKHIVSIWVFVCFTKLPSCCCQLRPIVAYRRCCRGRCLSPRNQQKEKKLWRKIQNRKAKHIDVDQTEPSQSNKRRWRRRRNREFIFPLLANRIDAAQRRNGRQTCKWNLAVSECILKSNFFSFIFLFFFCHRAEARLFWYFIFDVRRQQNDRHLFIIISSVRPSVWRRALFSLFFSYFSSSLFIYFVLAFRVSTFDSFKSWARSLTLCLGLAEKQKFLFERQANYYSNHVVFLLPILFPKSHLDVERFVGIDFEWLFLVVAFFDSKISFRHSPQAPILPSCSIRNVCPRVILCVARIFSFHFLSKIFIAHTHDYIHFDDVQFRFTHTEKYSFFLFAFFFCRRQTRALAKTKMRKSWTTNERSADKKKEEEFHGIASARIYNFLRQYLYLHWFAFTLWVNRIEKKSFAHKRIWTNKRSEFVETKKRCDTDLTRQNIVDQNQTKWNKTKTMEIDVNINVDSDDGQTKR